MADKKPMTPPKSGGKPKQIKTKNAPGGSQTPGEKAKRAAQTTDGNNG